MKKVFSALLVSAFIVVGFRVSSKTVYADGGLFTGAKSACVMEADGLEVIFSKGEEKRLPIASMTKIMTLNIVFDRISSGELDENEEVTVSKTASGMGGSQVFLRANENYLVKDLVKSVIVASANDSSVALAEKIAGSEQAFVDIMNQKCEEWGMKNTAFSNATGLPGGKQYSTAKDVAVMFSRLVKVPEFFKYGGIWLDSFAHADGTYTTITNTNKLIRSYQGCDGGKTGYTADAGFCVAATAKRGALRMICVVLGERTSAERFDEVSKGFDYSFANYANKILVEKKEEVASGIAVKGGAKETLSAVAESELTAFFKRGEKGNYKTSFFPTKNLVAPIKKGDEVGTVIAFKDGVEIKRVKAVAAESVERLSFIGAVERVADKW